MLVLLQMRRRWSAGRCKPAGRREARRPRRRRWCGNVVMLAVRCNARLTVRSSTLLSVRPRALLTVRPAAALPVALRLGTLRPVRRTTDRIRLGCGRVVHRARSRGQRRSTAAYCCGRVVGSILRESGGLGVACLGNLECEVQVARCWGRGDAASQLGVVSYGSLSRKHWSRLASARFPRLPFTSRDCPGRRGQDSIHSLYQ